MERQQSELLRVAEVGAFVFVFFLEDMVLGAWLLGSLRKPTLLGLEQVE
jgi:hypothetical protein